MATDVMVPTLGESITEATLGKWLKAPGEAVKTDEPIANLETDKVAIDVVAPADGTLTEQLVAEGDTVNIGAVIARIAEGKQPPAAATPAPADRTAVAKAEAAAKPAAAAAPAEDSQTVTLSPSVRRLVLEHHLDPSAIHGTGKDGRLTKEDVLAAAKDKPAEAPAAKQAEDSPPPAAASTAASAPAARSSTADGRHEERVRMTRLRQTIAARLKEAQNTAAMLTTFNDVDMSAVIEARDRYRDLFEKKHGIRLGFMSFFVKAACLALRDVPSVNGSIDGEEIVYRDYVDVSVAVSAPQGLVVPVVRDAQALSFAEIETTIADFGKSARDGTLKLEEMRGGTFTISNGGVFGSLMSTPIINPPQSAVLGLHRIEQRAVVRDGAIVARPMMYLALSYDHRLIDGREAVTFLVRIKEAIEDPTRLLIDL
jgi:2-oxoglutarate dehydrogenase E2 component (dihydrolipoamide succinyltransferase)